MSVMELSQFIALPLLDIIPVEPSTGGANVVSSGSFDDYLQRAQSSSAAAGESAASDSSRDAGQPQPSRAGESRSGAAPQPRPEKNEDNTDTIKGKEPDGNANLPAPDSRAAADKNKPVEQDQVRSSTNKKEKDGKKDKNDDSDSSAVENDQNNRLNAEISADAGNAKNCLQSGGDALSIKAEPEGASNSIRAAAKDAETKEAADAGSLAKAETLAGGAMQAAAPQAKDASISASGKKKELEKTGLEGDKNAGNPAGAQAIESALDAGIDRISAARTWKGTYASAREMQGKAADQNEKAPSLAGRAADAAVLPSAGQDPSAGAAALNSAVLQAVVNPPSMPTMPVKDKIDQPTSDRPVDIVSGNKPGDAAIALERLGQPGSKTTASQQGEVDEAGSDFSSERFIQRVEQAFSAMSDRGGTVRLRLSPPELGSLRVEISVNKGVMKARVEAETKEAKNLLLENLPALRDRLAQQNIEIQKFDVDLREQSSGGTSQQTADQAETGSGGGNYRGSHQQTPETNAAGATTATLNPFKHDGQLNVIV